jgi:hypothetical protein
MKQIGIVGSRKRNSVRDFRLVQEKFFQIYNLGDRIVSGGCDRGGDSFAEDIARDNGIPILILYPPKKRGGYFIRNGWIAKESLVLIACIVNPYDPIDSVLKRKKGGAEDTIRKFVKLMKSNLHLV